MEDEVKLLGFWSSPFVHRVIWALKLKGIPYEYVEEEDLMSNKSELLLRYNPIHKKVPVLVHRGKPIVESTVILEYIEETWPEGYPLLPREPYDRAIARFWTKFGEDKIQTLYSFFKTVGEIQQNVIMEARDVFKILEEHGLGEKKFFGGTQIGLTDLAFGWIAIWLESLEAAAGVKLLDVHNFPRLLAWTEDFKKVDIIRENVPNHDELSARFKRQREMIIRNDLKCSSSIGNTRRPTVGDGEEWSDIQATDSMVADYVRGNISTGTESGSLDILVASPPVDNHRHDQEGNSFHQP